MYKFHGRQIPHTQKKPSSGIIPILPPKRWPGPNWPLFRWKTWDSKILMELLIVTLVPDGDQSPGLCVPDPEITDPVENNWRSKSEKSKSKMWFFWVKTDTKQQHVGKLPIICTKLFWMTTK